MRTISKHAFAFGGGLLVIAAGCSLSGASNESTMGQPIAEVGVTSQALSSDLPECTPANITEVYYVESEDAYYYCDGASYQLVEAELKGKHGNSQAWLATAAAAHVPNCPAGGHLVQLGPDLDNSGTIDANEIVVSNPLCDDLEGSDCSIEDDGKGQVTLTCENGVTVSFAAPHCGNGIVEAGEACDGADCADDCSAPDLCPADPEKLEPGVCGCGVADDETGCFVACPTFSNDPVGELQTQLDRWLADGECTTEVVEITCDGSQIALTATSAEGSTSYASFSADLNRPPNLHDSETIGVNAGVCGNMGSLGTRAGLHSPAPTTCTAIFDDVCSLLPAP